MASSVGTGGQEGEPRDEFGLKLQNRESLLAIINALSDGGTESVDPLREAMLKRKLRRAIGYVHLLDANDNNTGGVIK